MNKHKTEIDLTHEALWSWGIEGSRGMIWSKNIYDKDKRDGYENPLVWGYEPIDTDE